jgi:phosphonoacetaldehyde hydrolase
MNETVQPTGVRAVIFDISGTVLDYGSRGPVVAFIELFARHGVTVTPDEARRPMGTHKRDHIWAMLSDASVADRWERAAGKRPDAALLDALYQEFTPLQTEIIKGFCDVIPGAPQVAKELRARGIKIANTTGFDGGMMTDLKRLAADGGYEPDLWVTPDLVGKGRPAPWMIYYAAKELDVYPLSTFVKVGDTPVDVAEAKNAGVWSVSVIRSSNEVGLSQDELAALSPADRDAKLATAREKLSACGPHYIIDTVADLIPIIDQISTRIARGDRP